MLAAPSKVTRKLCASRSLGSAIRIPQLTINPLCFRTSRISTRAYSETSILESTVPSSVDTQSGKSFKFDVESAVTGSASDPTRFSCFISNAWSVGDAPNGGYLMTIAIRSALQRTTFPDPITVTAYYASKTTEEEPADVEVKSLYSSKSSETMDISITQKGVLRCKFLATFGDLERMEGTNFNHRRAPILPVLSNIATEARSDFMDSAVGIDKTMQSVNCSVLLRQALGDKLRIAREIEFISPKSDPFVQYALRGKTAGADSTVRNDQQGHEAVNPAQLNCWVSFSDGRAPCLTSLSFLCDALPPPVLNISQSNWVPTLEYTVHFWARPSTTTTTDIENTSIDKAGGECGEAASTVVTYATSHSESGSGAGAIENRKEWLRAKFETSYVRNSLLYTDGEIWSADGRVLLATSRQIARILIPR